MLKKIFPTIALAALVTVAPVAYFDTADAQRSSGSSYSRPSSGSSYSRPSSGSSYSRPSTVAPARPSTPSVQPRTSVPRTAAPPQSTSGYTRPATPPTPRSQSGYTRPSQPQSWFPRSGTSSRPAAPQPNRSALPSALIGGAAGAAVGSTLSQPAQAESNSRQSSAPASQSGYTRPPAAEVQRSQSPAAPNTALNDAARRSMSANSLEQYRRERAESKSPPRPVQAQEVRKDPTYNQTRDRYGSVDEYMRQRQRHVEDLRRRAPDAYRYSRDMSPNYGMYDSSFLMGLILGSIGSSSSNAAWLDSQRDQDWYRQWRLDMERRATDDADLRSRIDAMDREMERQRSLPAPATAATLPEGVPNSLAIAPEAMITAETTDKRGFSWGWIMLIGLIVSALAILISLYRAGARSNRQRFSH
jgi:hypothetical protein